VNDQIAHPPSLINIFKELETDLGVTYAESGNLERWAKQGVLLLNATLTVRAHNAGSHQKMGWEQFTDAVISKISSEKEGIVFLLWGGFAKKKGAKIDRIKHCVLESGHPSPLSANRGYWFGNKHFSKTNIYLKNHNIPIVKW
jgi:uracil-DNA glycosylase